MTRQSGTPSSLDAAARGILSGMERERDPKRASNAGERPSDVREGIEERLRELAQEAEVDPIALKRETRRLLVLDLADAPDAYNRRETIKLLSDIEGYKKPVVPTDGASSETDREIERLSKAARDG